MENLELYLTDDGSHSLRRTDLNETFHSRHGAIQESLYVFIKEGLGAFESKDSLHILEVGFGTGLNAWLTGLYQPESQTVFYTAFETKPLPTEVIAQLNYPQCLGQDRILFEHLHALPWNKFQAISPFFNLQKRQESLEKLTAVSEFDLVYFDAFAPDIQPELWTEERFKQVFSAMKPKGLLVTYCAKSLVQRALKNVGFLVEKRPGPPGKREMIRAWKS